jgi:Peroxiredoxin
MLEVGQPAPPFSLQSDTDETLSLDDLKGRPVVVYFYPRDDTPGCTRQACSILDSWAEFGRIGANVIGVSPQSPKSHRKFKEKYGLPFPLLADTEHTMAEDYGVLGREEELRQDLDGDRALDLRDRRRRQPGRDQAPGEAG